MDTFLGRYKNLLVLLGVLLAQFIALAVQVRSPAGGSDGKGNLLLRHWVVALVAPPEKAVVHTGSDARGFWGDYIDLRHTREENQALHEEVNRLRLEQAGLLEDARQGQRLQALLAFKEHYVSATVPAQVIGTAGSDQARVLYIDKGARDGLAVDQPVITPDGIVGKIKEVFPHTAQVLEINDQSSGAGVLLEKTRLRGVLRGNAYGQPQVIDILPDERIKPGEPVLTSGGDQIFPRGLPVGTVEKVVADPEREPYVDIVLKPAANLSHLEEVLVVTSIGDALPAKTQRDLAHSQAVAGAEAEKQRASDILADKLPGLIDPNEPQMAEQKPTGGEEVGRPIQPPQPLHADRFSPNAAPPASSLVPGKAPAVVAAAATLPASPAPLKHPAIQSSAVTASASRPVGTPASHSVTTPANRPAQTVANISRPTPASNSTAQASKLFTGQLAAAGVGSGAVPHVAPAKAAAPRAATAVINGVVHTTVVDGPTTARQSATGTTARPVTGAVAPALKPAVNAKGNAAPVGSPAVAQSPVKGHSAYVEPKWVGKPPAAQGQPQ